MSELFYSGVGARKTPVKILEIMTRVAEKMNVMGYTLRSGGATGADKAFEKGAIRKEIYYASDATPESMDLASRYHPSWGSMGDYARRLHGRNSFQILGRDLMTASDFVACWTPDGCEHHYFRTRRTGGTGTAISIASMNEIRIPVYNLKNEKSLRSILKWLEK